MSRAAPLSIGLIGLGKHGERYLGHVQRDLPELRIAALSRQNADAGRALAGELGVRFHADPRDLVNDPGVEAVIAVVPPRLHASIVEACVAARRPLLIEKPFAVDAAEAFRLRDRVEDSGLPCLVAQTLRFSSVVRTVREWLPEIGLPSQVLLGQSFEPTRLGWLDDPAVSGGGNVLHTGVHMFDLLRHLTGGEVREAYCALDRVTTKRTEDSFVASFAIEGPHGRVLGSAAGSRATESRAGEIRIVAERGQIVADHVHRTASLLADRRVVRSVEVADVPTVREVLQTFAAVARGAPSPITARDGAAAVAIADACYRSAETGTRVRVPAQ